MMSLQDLFLVKIGNKKLYFLQLMEFFQILQNRNLKYLKLIKKINQKISKYSLRKSYPIIDNYLDMIP